MTKKTAEPSKTEEVAGDVVDPTREEPEQTETHALVKTLPSEVGKCFLALLQAMSPDKPGFEEMGGARWAVSIVKIVQGMTTDAPANAALGDLYTNTGDKLEKPWAFIPIYMHYSHTRFEPGNNQPTCRSDNGITNAYGEPCKQCPDLPFRDGQRTNCNKTINVYAYDKGFTNIYHIQFTKTSYRAGSKLYSQASNSSVPWQRIYALDTAQKQRQNEPGKYGVFTVTPTGEQVDPVYFPMIRKIFEIIKEQRRVLLSRVEERASVGQKVVDNLPADFGGGSSKDGDKDGQPDLSDM